MYPSSMVRYCDPFIDIQYGGKLWQLTPNITGWNDRNPNVKIKLGPLLCCTLATYHREQGVCLPSTPFHRPLVNSPPCFLMQFPWSGESCTGSYHSIGKGLGPTIWGPLSSRAQPTSHWSLPTGEQHYRLIYYTPLVFRSFSTMLGNSGSDYAC